MFPCFRPFSLILLLLAAVTVSAQISPMTVAPSVPRATVSAASYGYLTRADTARAIRKLFKSRRGGGIGWLAFGTAGILASTLPAQQSTSAGVWTPGVVAGTAFMLVGLNKRIQFRPGRERAVLRGLAATGRLPTSVSRRLHGQFAPVLGATTDYNPLLAKGIAPENPGTPLTPAQLLDNARADTLRAIDRMFERRRKGGKTWAYIGVSGALAMVRVLTAAPSDSNPKSNSVDGGGVALLTGVFIGVPAVASITTLTAFSEQHQEEVERAYRSGKSLPKKIRLRLKKKDLQPLD